MPYASLNDRAPKVSVVIPLYNRASSITATVDSVLAQTLPVHEIVIVDDASRDDSVAVVCALAARHPQVRLIALERNGGGGRARNAGIDAAKGEWLALLDSDDLWMPDKLARQFEALAGHADGDMICFTNLEVDRHDGTPLFRWNDAAYRTGDDIKQFKLYRDQVVQTSTLLLPTALARRVRFRDTLRRNQDDDFVYRAAAGGASFVYVDEALVRYSADAKADRTSARKNLVPLLDWLEVSREYLTQRERAYYYMRSMFAFHWEDDRAGAIRFSLGFLRRGHVTPLSYARALLRVATPSGLRQGVKRLLARG